MEVEAAGTPSTGALPPRGAQSGLWYFPLIKGPLGTEAHDLSLNSKHAGSAASADVSVTTEVLSLGRQQDGGVTVVLFRSLLCHQYENCSLLITRHLI